jgi:photosynthetic reaction center H subunit
MLDVTKPIVGHIDLALIALYVFWAFFIGLVIYLRGEDRREGYPLVADPHDPMKVERFNLLMPAGSKEFRLMHGGTAKAPGGSAERADLAIRSSSPWPGTPYLATGNAMKDGVGAAAWANRRDEPERTFDGQPMIVPMRTLPDTSVAAGDVDPRGLPVIGGDHGVGGTVVDLWIDRAEPQIRYLEVDPTGAAGRTVLLPMTMARIDGLARRVTAWSLLSTQFADVPRTKSPDVVTKLEEDQITAYYGGGTLYATAQRAEPIV